MKIKKTMGEKIFDAANIVFMAIVIVAILYPFLYIVSQSFNEGVDSAQGGIYFFPRNFTLTNYQAVFQNDNLLSGFAVSILRTVIGTVTAVFFTAMVAFALSHRQLRFRKAYMIYGTITMFASAGLIPYYLVIFNLGLRNTFLMYIVPALFNFYNCILMITFFRSIPEGLFEAANIDGAGYWRIFLQIALPLSGAIIATMCLFIGVYHWNDYFIGVLYIDDQELLPIQTVLYKIVAEAQGVTMLTNVNLPDVAAQRTLTSESIKMAAMVVATVPIVCIYPFLQKFFEKGVMIGSLKE